MNLKEVEVGMTTGEIVFVVCMVVGVVGVGALVGGLVVANS